MAAKPIVDGVETLAKLVGRALGPAFYSRADRALVEKRRRLAKLLLTNLDLLEANLHWTEETHVDLRTTVAAIDLPERQRRRLPKVRRPTVTYRTQPLSKALTSQSDRLILLQGAPGTGKSVALRSFARDLLDSAKTSRSRKSRLAIYVSLRDFECDPKEIDAEKLQSYIAALANASRSKTLTDYFRDDFANDLDEGVAVLLLDAFDEIPAILGSTNIDSAVKPYVHAITNLMGASESTCVVASREYKGPRVPGWTRLQLIGLSYEEQLAFLRTHGLPKQRIREIDQLLLDPRKGFSTDLRNPLHLSLLAQFLDVHGRPPTRPSELFQDYVEQRLRDAGALPDSEDFGTLVSALQTFAFDLTRRPDTGLSARQEVLLGILTSAAPGGAPDEAVRLLELARESKLVSTVRQHQQPRIAFTHRRIQEYFATQYVIEHPGELDVKELASNGKWRETAVALLQVQADSPRDIEPLLAAIEGTLRQELAAAESPDGDFEWTPAVVHVMELLVAAHGADPTRLTPGVRAAASNLVQMAWRDGGIGDRKFALDCLPLAHAKMQSQLVEGAFRSDSAWLRTTALRECATLQPLPDHLDAAIRRLLITMLGDGRLFREAARIDADLRRLHLGRTFVKLRKLLVPYHSSSFSFVWQGSRIILLLAV